MQLPRDFKNTYIKMNEREEEIWNDLVSYLNKKEMTVAEIRKISKALNISINDHLATAINNAGF